MAPELVQLPDRRRDVVRDQAERLGLPATVRAIEVLGEMLVELRHAPDPRVLLDVALVKLTNVDADASPAALLARIEKLERAQSAGSGAPSGPVAAGARRGSARGGAGSGGGRAPTGRERDRRGAVPSRSRSPPIRGGAGQGRQRRHRGAGATGRRGAAGHRPPPRSPAPAAGGGRSGRARRPRPPATVPAATS